ncbi:MAG: response regulator, partial [Dolichospermum sp.]
LTSPDIIIIDDQLPFVSGVELLRTLSALPSLRTKMPKFVLFINDSTRSNVHEAISGGFSAVIKKPFVPSYLMQIIRQCLFENNHHAIQQ